MEIDRTGIDAHAIIANTTDSRFEETRKKETCAEKEGSSTRVNGRLGCGFETAIHSQIEETWQQGPVIDQSDHQPERETAPKEKKTDSMGSSKRE